MFAATTCADGRFPWSPDTPVPARSGIFDSAVAALPSGAFGPFGNWSARLGTAFFCKLWPSPAGQAPLAAGPLPDVPVIALSGGFDLRTPTASAAALVSLFPQGHLLVVPGVGHSVLGSDFSLCSQRAVRTWIQSGTARASCPHVAPLVRPLSAFPQRVVRAPRATLLVAEKAVREGVATWFQVLFSTAKIAPPGLDGGKLVPLRNGFRLVRYALVPGVFVSGTLRVSGLGLVYALDGTLRVSGPSAAPGTLRVASSRVSGSLGGTRVSGSV